MLKFVDFPYDFDTTNNLFLEALSSVATDVDLNNIIFIGCYPQISLLAKSSLFLKSRMSNQGMTNWLNHQRGLSTLMKIQGKKVWVTFENRRIPFEGADLTISFDF